MPHPEIITRRNLPHWYVPGAVHFVTYRLADSIPVHVLQRLHDQRRARLRQPPAEGMTARQHRLQEHKRFFAAYDSYLDRTCKIDWLTIPAVAAVVRGNLLHHNGSKYHLLAYCIMPNHVHALFQPLDLPSGLALPDAEAEPDSGETPDSDSPLSAILHSLKSYTAHKANVLLRRSGQLWQHESYDHWVRDDAELERIVTYIIWNPVKANLVQEPHLWFYGSAHDRFLEDGSTDGYLLYPADAP
jgi:putative DNA methylase